MIDKTAYFFWQGEQMSWLRYMTLRSFVYHNHNTIPFHAPNGVSVSLVES